MIMMDTFKAQQRKEEHDKKVQEAVKKMVNYLIDVCD